MEVNPFARFDIRSCDTDPLSVLDDALALFDMREGNFMSGFNHTVRYNVTFRTLQGNSVALACIRK